MKFICFIVFSIAFQQCINYKTYKFDQFFQVEFLRTKCFNNSIPLNHILPICTNSIFITSANICQVFRPLCPNFANSLPLLTRFYYLSTLYSFLPIKIASTLFFSSSAKHQSHHLVACQAAGFNSLLIYFLHDMRCLCLSRQLISVT